MLAFSHAVDQPREGGIEMVPDNGSIVNAFVGPFWSSNITLPVALYACFTA